jgi:L-amino acid N-acyltransferase YncA
VNGDSVNFNANTGSEALRKDSRPRRGGANPNTRVSQWPNRKDMAPPPPERSEARWEVKRNSWDSSTIDSGRASSGWGTRQKKRDARASGVPLTGYDGNFAPPPMDWDSRPAFREGQTYEQIMQWMSGIESLLCGINRCVPTEDVTTSDGSTHVFSMSDDAVQDGSIKQMGEIAPQHWVPISVGRKAPSTFWNLDILAELSPAPCDVTDLEGAQPWWERLRKGLHFLDAPSAPAELGIDPDEEDADQKLKRKHDLGSLTHAKNRINLELERRDAKLAKQRKAAARQERLAITTDNVDHRRIQTGANIFIRAATKHDMDSIAAIYNFYIVNTVSTAEFEPRTKDQMQQRWQDVRLNQMPYLVACERGGIIKANRNKTRPKRDMRAPDEDVVLPDKIVGFAFADDFNDLKGMYRFTAEMEVYVHNDYYQKGVAKCLVDKLMGLLDSNYLERGGYDCVGDDIDGTGRHRVVKNVIVHLSYDRPEKLEWVGKWLETWLQFKQVGNLVDIGTKNGKA